MMEVMVHYIWKEKIVEDGEKEYKSRSESGSGSGKWWKCPAPGARYMEL